MHFFSIKKYPLILILFIYLSMQINADTINDYYLSESSEQLIYIEKNPNNQNVEEGYLPVTNIMKQDLKNDTKTILLKGCNEPSTIGDGCCYSNPILLNDNRTLYYLKDQWMTSNAIYRLDLLTLENKFITDGNDLRVINEGKYKNYLIVSKHKYMKEGGSYDYYYLVSPEGKQITTITNPESFSYYKSKVLKTNSDLNNLIEIFLYEWDNAHNQKNSNTFNLIYNDYINYYNSKNINKSIAIKDKKELLKKYSNFHQTSNLLKIVNLSGNFYKLNYEKNVIYGNNKKTFSSYLIIKIINNKAIIVEEND